MVASVFGGGWRPFCTAEYGALRRPGKRGRPYRCLAYCPRSTISAVPPTASMRFDASTHEEDRR
jgi:hypothetical protein